MDTLFLAMYGGVAALLATLGAGTFVQARKADAQLRAFASRCGLEYRPARRRNPPHLQGRLQGVPVRVYTEVRSAGKSRTTYLIHKAFLSSKVAPPGLQIGPRGLLHALNTNARGVAIETRIPEIDQAFTVRGVSTLEAREFFGRPGVKEALLELRRHEPTFIFERDTLVIESNFLLMLSLDRAPERIEKLVRCAHQLEHAGILAAGPEAVGSPVSL